MSTGLSTSPEDRLIRRRARDEFLGGIGLLDFFRPLATPTRTELVDALIDTARADPRRTMLWQDTGSAWSVPADAELRTRAEIAVLDLPDELDVAPPDAVQAWWRRNVRPDVPVQYVLGRTTLALGVDHRLADGSSIHALSFAPLFLATGIVPPQPNSGSSSARAFGAAVRETYLRHPRRGLAFLRHHPRSAVRVLQETWSGDRPLGAGRDARNDEDPAGGYRTGFRYRHMPAPAAQALLAWSKSRGIASVVALMALIRAAFEPEGIRFGRAETMIDLRRYSAEPARISGNFVIAEPLDVDACADDASRRFRESLDAGHPLTSFAVAMHHYRHRGPDSDDGPAAATHHLVVNNRVRDALVEQLPWTGPAEDTVAQSFIEVDGPGLLDLDVIQVLGIMRVNVSFDLDAYPDDAVDRALARMVSDPVGLLEAADQTGSPKSAARAEG